jgi:hypothetical protein
MRNLFPQRNELIPKQGDCKGFEHCSVFLIAARDRVTRRARALSGSALR